MNTDRFRFRVWDTKDKEYLDPNYYEGCYLLPNGNPYVGMTIYNGIYDEYQVIPPKQLIVEQCTGLKDKNGKLIFEGDVVSDMGIEAIVGWYSDRYMIEYDDGSISELAIAAEALEIIGNIHEREENE